MQALRACTFTQLRLHAVRQFIRPPMHGRTGDKVVLIAPLFLPERPSACYTIYFYFLPSLTWHILWPIAYNYLTSSFRHYFDFFFCSRKSLLYSYFKCIHSGQHFLPHSTALGYPLPASSVSLSTDHEQLRSYPLLATYTTIFLGYQIASVQLHNVDS